MPRRYLNSYVTVHSPSRAGDNLVPRIPEIEAIQRMAFGDMISASNRAAEVYDPEAIKCSVCGQRKHHSLFDRCAGNRWRFSRSYECKVCRKAQRLREHAAGHVPRWKRGTPNL